MSRSSALVYSTRPPVSVYGTGDMRLTLRAFSREPDYLRYPRARGLEVLSGSAQDAHLTAPRLPTPLNGLFRQPAGVPLLRLPDRSARSAGILTGSSIGFALRLILRSRLTLIRLALIRKPWSYGGQVSRLPYRYLYLHLLFHTLQSSSRCAFDAEWNAPLPMIVSSQSFGRILMPDYYPRQTPRLVSCYALFK